MMTRRWKLVVAYCGTGFEGWQSQPSGNAIQDHLSRAARTIHGSAGAIHGSGRTDAGVHALAQVAHFDVAEQLNMDGAAWLRAFNSNLPPAIRVMACEPAPPGFHAQYSATGKTYRYEIHNAPVLPPLRAGRAWHVAKPLDRARVQQAAALFEGGHDFVAYAAKRGGSAADPKDTWRTIFSSSAEFDGPEARLTLTGNGFLYRMVRLIAGAAVRCGLGRLELDTIRQSLDQPQDIRRAHPLTAPAAGLYLTQVCYDTEPNG